MSDEEFYSMDLKGYGVPTKVEELELRLADALAERDQLREDQVQASAQAGNDAARIRELEAERDQLREDYLELARLAKPVLFHSAQQASTTLPEDSTP